MGQQTHIGKGVVKLRNVIPKTNHPFVFVVELVHQGRRGIVQKGMVQMEGTILSNISDGIVHALIDLFTCQSCMSDNGKTYSPTPSGDTLLRKGKRIKI